MTAPAFPRRRLLVVDDERSVCDAVKMMLAFDGHEVETAGSAHEALDLYRKGKFDLVFTDWQMPGMKGDKLAVAIKAKDPLQPIVMITAHTEILPDPIPGIDLIISKPFLLEDLRRAIAKLAPAGRTQAK